MSSPFTVKREHIITLKLPFPPSINRYYVNKRGGGKAIGAEGRVFREKTVDCLRSYVFENGTIEDSTQVWIEVCPPNRRKRDLDNICKALLDALTHAGIYKDDSLINDLRLVRGDVVKGGFVRVHIAKIIKDQKD